MSRYDDLEAAHRTALSEEAAQKFFNLRERLDRVMEAVADDDAETSPVWDNYQESLREDAELERRIHREKWARVLELSQRNRRKP